MMSLYQAFHSFLTNFPEPTGWAEVFVFFGFPIMLIAALFLATAALWGGNRGEETEPPDIPQECACWTTKRCAFFVRLFFWFFCRYPRSGCTYVWGSVYLSVFCGLFFAGGVLCALALLSALYLGATAIIVWALVVIQNPFSVFLAIWRGLSSIGTTARDNALGTLGLIFTSILVFLVFRKKIWRTVRFFTLFASARWKRVCPLLRIE